jgi:hypothetical protein
VFFPSGRPFPSSPLPVRPSSSHLHAYTGSTTTFVSPGMEKRSVRVFVSEITIPLTVAPKRAREGHRALPEGSVYLYPLFTFFLLCHVMTFVNMDSMDFYQPRSKAGQSGDRRHTTSNNGVPVVDGDSESTKSPRLLNQTTNRAGGSEAIS